MADDKETDDRLKRSLQSAGNSDKPPATLPSDSPPLPTQSPPPASTKPFEGAPRPKIGNVAASIKRRKPAAKKTITVTDDFDYDVAMRMAFLGAGQGGGRVADSFYRMGYRRVAVFNTTDMDFGDLSDGLPTYSLDVGGAAKDTGQARDALRGREEEVRELLIRSWGNDPECAMICACLGGGTGSGTIGSLVEIARTYMQDTVGFQRVGALVSLPTPTEGFQVNRNAYMGMQTLIEMEVSPILIVDNTRIHQLYRPAMSKIHRKANEMISQMLHLFNQLAAIKSQFLTFDRSEFAQLLDGGICVMGATDIPDIETPADISAAIREELVNNILAEADLSRGRKAACLFVGSQKVLDEFDLDYFDAGFGALDRILGSAYGEEAETIIHRGVYLGADEGLQCYTMISELDPPKERLIEMAKKGGLDTRNGGSRMAAYLGVDD